ncbi:MAG: selenium-dependent molybdenum cofactor biosynthesis protein YqeB [Clostridiales bacterium]
MCDKYYKKMTAVLRGGGDLATGVAQKLWRSGFQLIILETPSPTTIRRTVALSTAIAEGIYQVEDMTARRIKSPAERHALWQKGEIPILADPRASALAEIKPDVLIDAIIAKKNLGTYRHMAPLTIALGPGFSAPKDVDAVIETMRGHSLGRLITEGEPLANTGMPGELGGKTAERVVHTPAAGIVRHLSQIGRQVDKGEPLFYLEDLAFPDDPDKRIIVTSPLKGTLRGLIAEGLQVPKGLKCADVDPRPAHEVDCYTISDKARCLGGAVLEACLYLKKN